MVVTTAVVGVSVAALAVGSALPSTDTAAASAALGQSLDASKVSGGQSSDAGNTTQAEAPRSGDARASRSQKRSGVSEPEQLPVWVRPAQGPLSSLFAARWGAFHYGIDFAAAYGSTVRAASAGTVIRSGWYGGYGQIVIIDHGNGITTRYGHNSELLVSVGDHVEAGDPISKVGSTGQSTGPHCHFEVRVDDVPEDPLSWLEDHDVSVTGVNTSL
ncbi:M23 family metallopeptidase [Cryptosporangium phraense]|uniref:M23 family metallopeptidase n=1 Tax=Cryptosporangium phraense TaxID=2593070 RepID=A0A545AUF7_9ACTN|nr:M23 family metallopeptidase [Cryptosporangium phraense]TQS44933.1 M23 family metallopeptidase [Cryptosporangium phraense]